MKKLMVPMLMAGLLISGFMSGCGGIVSGSGKLDTREMDFSDFSSVEISHGFEVEITQADSYHVSITADDNLFDDNVRISKSGSTLKIGLRSNYIYQSVTLTAMVTMPDLYRLALSGGSNMSITGFDSSHDLSVDMSGGSRTTGDIVAGDGNFNLSGGSWLIADIVVGDARFNLSGGSHVNLEGSADELDINGSGGSQLDLETFLVDNADINLSGGGRATVNVTGILGVHLSGGSKVLYIGDPTLGDIDLTGDSSISPK